MRRPSPRMDAVVEYLHRHGDSHAADIARGVDISQKHANITLRRLRAKGEVMRVRRGVYRLTRLAAEERSSNEQLGVLPAVEADSIVLPAPPPLPDTGLQLANPYTLQQALAALTEWLSAYSGPADDPTAVSVVMAVTHVERALGVPNSQLG